MCGVRYWLAQALLSDVVIGFFGYAMQIACNYAVVRPLLLVGSDNLVTLFE
jgi:hypothetical protein